MRRFKEKSGILAILILLLIFIASCATFQYQTREEAVISTTYKTLVVAANVYETGMGTLKELRDKGLVTDEQFDKAHHMANLYYVSYHVTVELLESFADTMTASDEQKLGTAMNEVARLIDELIKYLNPIFLEYDKKPLKR